jgi:hypothetical protein
VCDVGIIEGFSSVSDSAFEDDRFEDFQPTREFLEKGDFEVLEHPQDGRRWGEFGFFRVVGHELVTNPDTCGKVVSMKGCLHVEKHHVVTLECVDYTGKIFFRKIRMYCYKSSCPICYKKGWAVREAESIEYRLKESSKRFGLVEHLVASVPFSAYHLPYKAMRALVRKILMKRGVIGGCMIFHGFRYKSSLGFFWSPHFHVLGFILGGYSRCRNCGNQVCKGYGNFGKCDGFEAVTRRFYEKDGFIVKVFGRRVTIFGSAWYQLHHSSYDSSVKNFHIATWFGVCSYRKLKITPKERRQLCPICQSELVEIRYIGSRFEQFEGKREGFTDYVEDGVVAWVEVVKSKSIAGARSNRITEDDYFRFPKADLVDKLLPKRVWGASWTLPKKVNL